MALAAALALALGPGLEAERLRGLLLALGTVGCVLVVVSVLVARVGLAVWSQAVLGVEYLGALSVRHGVAGLEPAAASAVLLAVGELVAWAVDAGSGPHEPAVHVGRGARLGLLLGAATVLAAVPLLVARGPALAGPLPVAVGAAAVVGTVGLIAVLIRR